jgi:vacuolar protein sorting-associated protein 52
LGVVAAEIETLQARSVQINEKLENRRHVEKLLGPTVEEISISPRTVRIISEGPIDENWVHALNDMESRATSVAAKAANSTSIRAIQDVKPLLTDLKDRVRYATRIPFLPLAKEKTSMLTVVS